MPEAASDPRDSSKGEAQIFAHLLLVAVHMHGYPEVQ